MSKVNLAPDYKEQPSTENYQTTKFETSKFERLSYSGFFLGQNIIYVISFQFLTYFYIEYVGLKLVDVTFMMLIVKIWDAVNDPIVGAIIDKCNFKKGKYIPWLKFASYFVPLSLLLMFININATYNVNLIYAYISYIIFDMVYTISDAPLFSLSTVMTTSTYERDTLLSNGRLAAAVAAITSAVFMSIKAEVGWTWAVGIYCAISFFVMFPLQFNCKERVKYNRNENITFREIFKYLFKNKYLIIYYIGYLAIGTTDTLQIMAVYFANSNLGDETLVTVIMAVVILPIIVIAPFLPKLINRFGKKKLTVFCSFATIILCIIQYFAGYSNFVVFLILAAIRIVFMKLPLLLYCMFTADCIEYGAYINGERTEAVAFAIQIFVTKLGAALCSTLCLVLLSAFGYVEQAASQTVETQNGIWIIMCLVPIVGYAIMIIIMQVYKLDEEKVAKMKELNLTLSSRS